MSITEESLRFLAENRIRDDRNWFQEHKADYKKLVEVPLLELSERLAPEMLKIDSSFTSEPRRTISRIWRDVRFSRDKTTYRDVMWVTFRRGRGMEYPTYWFEFSPRGYTYGCGYYQMPPVVMEYVRELVLKNDRTYKAARKAAESLPGFELEGELYKRSRYPDTTPKQKQWLDRKGITYWKRGGEDSFMFADNLADMLLLDYKALAPFYNLLLKAHLNTKI
jgi:uncharacterized protein (TIGR02453 family)